MIDLIEEIQSATHKKAMKEYFPIQSSDVGTTYAVVQSLIDFIDYEPRTSITEEVTNFVNWYKNYYKI